MRTFPPVAGWARLTYVWLSDGWLRERSEGILIKRPKWPEVVVDDGRDHAVQSMSAKDAKYGFGRLIDLARAEPVMVAKHGRPVVVVMSVEEYERLKGCKVGDGSQKLNDRKSVNPAFVEEN